MISKNIEQMKVEISNHIAADALVQGRYWDGEKGCFISCLTHSSKAEDVLEKFGLPVELVKICESIHEGLPEGEYQDFFAKVGDAIEVDGKDLSKVHWLFLKEILESLPKQELGVQQVIEPVIAGMNLLTKGQEWPDAYAAAARAARAAAAADAADAAAADAAARAARASFAARAYASYSAYAAYAADAAAYAADVYGADADAYGAADAADARIKQKEIMLRLLKEAPMAVAS